MSLPKPRISLNRDKVAWGEDVTITCSILSEFFGGTFILKKTSGTFSQTASSSSTSATFSIHKVDLDHNGSYQCQYQKTISEQNFSSSLSDAVRLSVNGKKTKQFPELDSSKNQKLKEPLNQQHINQYYPVFLFVHLFFCFFSEFPETPYHHKSCW